MQQQPIVPPQPVPPQLNANRPYHTGPDVDGARAVAEGIEVGVAVYEAVRWQYYKRAVGVENTSLHGFRVWKSQMRTLTKAQLRVNVARGLLFLGLAVALYLLANIPDLGVPGSMIFVIMGIGALVLGIRNLMHRRPPQAKLDEINNRHNAQFGHQPRH